MEFKKCRDYLMTAQSLFVYVSSVMFGDSGADNCSFFVGAEQVEARRVVSSQTFLSRADKNVETDKCVFIMDLLRVKVLLQLVAMSIPSCSSADTFHHVSSPLQVQFDSVSSK